MKFIRKPVGCIPRIRPKIIFYSLSILSFIFINPNNSFPQDTSFVKLRKDTTVHTQIPLLLDNNFKYLIQDNPDTVTRNEFLWLPLKNVEEIFNYMPGYYLKYMDVGQVNNLSYNQLDYFYTGVFRNGRPINDLLDGSIDFNLFSRNEIEHIELTNGFGNFLYNYNNGINILQRQVFRNRPYSEISFWQDRFENLFFDGNYHQNLFKYFNVNFGVTKHSYDGKYINSDFDKWLGRLNLNFIGSSKFNVFFSTDYSKIQRGLNEGIDPRKIPNFERGTLFDVNLAKVRNPDAYERRERFDIDFGFVLKAGRKNNFFTKLQMFVGNSFREYRDEENRPTPNGFFISDNSRWIDYGVKLLQSLEFNFSKSSRLISRTEVEYNKDFIHSNFSKLRNSERKYLIEYLSLQLKYFLVDAYLKTYKFDYFKNDYFFDYGVKPSIVFNLNRDFRVNVFGSYSSSNKLPNYQQFFLNSLAPNEEISSLTGGGKVYFPKGSFSIEYFNNTVKNKYFASTISQSGLSSEEDYSGLNSKLDFNLFNFDALVNLSYLSLPLYKGEGTIFFESGNRIPILSAPKISGIAMLAYHNSFFKNKLEIKIGLNSRFWGEYRAVFYSGFYNLFSDRFTDTNLINYKSYTINSNASLDFFIIGKINKAIFGLTFENILNKAILTAGIYPYQNRGGLGNVLSRFNVTWYFLN